MSVWTETEIGQIPVDWELIKVDTVLQDKGISVGVMYPGADTPNGIPLIRAGDMKKGKIDSNINYRISKETNALHKRTVLQGGELFVVLVGDPGVSVVVTSDFEGWNVARAIGVLRLKNKNEGKYISYSFRHPGVRHNILASCNTTVQATLNLKELKEISIPWPEKKIRNSITTILSSLDDKIDLLQRQNATLEAMAETLFKQWFVEEANEEWEEVKLGDFISLKHGYAFKGEHIVSEPTKYILVTPGNFKIGVGFKSEKFKYCLSNEIPANYIFKEGDLVVTMTDLSVDGNTLGYPAIIPISYSGETYLHNQRVGKVEFKKQLGKYFLYNLMKTEDYQWYILSGASGTSIRHTSPSSISSYTFKLPPGEIILKFENYVLSLQEKLAKNKLQIRTLTTLRDVLLPKLMSGEVRVVV